MGAVSSTAGGIKRLVIIGMGDVTTRFVLPSVRQLRERGEVGDDLEVVVVSRHEDDGDDLDPAEATHHTGDSRSPEDLRAVLAGEDPIAVYLALPPTIFASTIEAIFDVGLPKGSRLLVEKPFGTDLDSAHALNELLHRELDEAHIVRVDHFLGEQTVHNVLGARFANTVLEPAWNSEHVESVEIVWDETLAMEGRAGSYDSIGALRDMLQNHLLQLLCLVAMEPPASFERDDLADRKVELLRAIRPARNVEESSVRARYTAGTIDGDTTEAYTDTDGVDPDQQTETFAQIELAIDTPRWRGVPFTLRSGKALATDRHEIVIRFRGCSLMEAVSEASPDANELRFTVGPDTIRLGLNVASGTDALFEVERAELCHDLGDAELDAYAVTIRAALTGDSPLSVRDDEVEESWRVVMPFVEAFAAAEVPLEEYAAGSSGPVGGARRSRA